MTKIKETIYDEKLQYLVYIGLSVGAVGLTGIVGFLNPLAFERFIGGINPLITSFLVVFLGFILLSFLLSQGGFAIYKKENLKGLVRASALAALFGFIIILVDLKAVFPADLNVLFPESLLFYPTIGFYAEILFHVLPLTMLLISLTALFRDMRHENRVWICIFIVSLLEPIYQTTIGFSSRPPLWAVTYVGLHVFFINLFQLIIFKRYDFVSMYAFRLAYYIVWHVGWGYVRLKVLF
jgi:hypothetical protein